MAFTNLVNYIKKVWKDAPSTDTPINAVNLNHMENGISDAATAINQLGQTLTAEDDLRFKFSKSGSKYGYKDANGTFHPFKTAHTGTYTASSRGAALDMGEDHSYRYVNTNNVPNTNSGTYSVASNGTHDMGSTNTNRYVSVNVPQYWPTAARDIFIDNIWDTRPYNASCSVGDIFIINDNGATPGVSGATLLGRINDDNFIYRADGTNVSIYRNSNMIDIAIITH